MGRRRNCSPDVPGNVVLIKRPVRSAAAPALKCWWSKVKPQASLEFLELKVALCQPWNIFQKLIVDFNKILEKKEILYCLWEPAPFQVLWQKHLSCTVWCCLNHCVVLAEISLRGWQIQYQTYGKYVPFWKTAVEHVGYLEAAQMSQDPC